MIKRVYEDLGSYFKKGKVLVLIGPRQVGKTTLIKNYLKTIEAKSKYVTGENIRVQNTLSSRDLKQLKSFCEGYEIIAIDEANKIPEIGANLKLMIDNINNIKIIISASSSFELFGQIGEPLTGRKVTLFLYPISFIELNFVYSEYELKEEILNDALIYGMFPEIISENNKKEKKEKIMELSEAYMLKDILSFERIKNSKIIFDLLKLLAFQIRGQVSYYELAQKLGIDSKTVFRYIDILEKSYILYNLRPYSGNLRNEITKKSKFYFYDNGLRNAIISNFNGLKTRDDFGKLWENFLVMERVKKQTYKKIYANNYFWRTWEGKEVDFIEERNGKIFGFEFKYGKSKKQNKVFVETYKDSQIKYINRENYLDFVL